MVLGEHGPRVLHTVGTFSGSMARSLASVGWAVKSEALGATGLGFYIPSSVIMTIALPPGVVPGLNALGKSLVHGGC